MSEPAPGPSSPQPEHQRLHERIGTWNVDCSFYVDPSAPPMKVQATDVVEAHGPFFTVGRFQADMLGMPFSGLATAGFDPTRQHYVSTWIDTLNPFMYVFTGQLNEDGTVLEMSGEAPDPHSKQVTSWRTAEHFLSANERTFEMWMKTPGGGPEIQLLRYVYTRAS